MSDEKHISACKSFKKKILRIMREIDKFDEENHLIFLNGGYSRVLGSLDRAAKKLDSMVEDIIGDVDEVDEEEFMKNSEVLCL